jgi:methionyl-tRNA formyltransferase
MTICIAGKNNIAVEILEYLFSNYNYPLLAICNKTDEGKDTWQRSLRLAANEYNVEIKQIEDVYNVSDLIFLSLEFDQIIKPEIFVSNQLYNVHFSLLPAYRGMYTSIMPILFGEKQSGVTLHKIDAGIDTGDIIEQIIIPIKENDTAEILYAKYIKKGIQIVKKNIDNILTKKVKSYVQPVEKSSYFSKKAIDFKNIQIDCKKTAWEIHNQIRAFVFRNYQLPTINGYRIYKSRILHTKSDKANVGRVQKVDDNILKIDAIDYIVNAYLEK